MSITFDTVTLALLNWDDVKCSYEVLTGFYCTIHLQHSYLKKSEKKKSDEK